MSNVNISVLSDIQVSSCIEEIARLRINIFKEYPYLYDGDLNYEADYLKKFVHTPDSIVVILKDNEHVVGAMTGLPLKYEDESIQRPWLEQSEDIEKVYYFSEILIYPEYRGKGFGQKIFDLAEKTVIGFNTYTIFSLATVIRPEDHPEKPGDYKELYAFWSKNGYTNNENLICRIPWKEIGEDVASSKPLMFWLKKLPAISQ